MSEGNNLTNKELNIHVNVKIYEHAIKEMQNKIMDLQMRCEHRHEESDIATDMAGNPFGRICLVCGKWSSTSK